ncbi:MAG: glycosyltransferase family 4 protein [Chloroflexi bacterium]|nr:glycosyltransferase family 4 protein [Chloroflexota bacterium]
MRILQVVHQFFPERVGGTEVYTLGLSKGLIERGHQAAVFHRAPDSPGLNKADWEGIPTYRASAGSMTPGSVFRANFGNPILSNALSKTITDFRPDLIHWEHLMGLPFSLVAQADHNGIPSVMTLHDYWIICANAQLLTNYDDSLCTGPRQGGLNCARCAIARAGAPFLWPGAPILLPLFIRRRQLLRRALARVAHFISPSRFLRQQAIAWGVDADILSHLPNGIDITGVRPRAPRGDKTVHFAYIGGLAPQKGVHVLIEAFNELNRDATLEIYGDITQFPDYGLRLQTLARSPHITFGGRLDRSGVWEVMSKADALMVPSLWYENAPVVMQEACAAKIPIITSKLGALDEWVQDGANGLLVPPGDVDQWRTTLRRLVDEPGLLAHLEANARPPVSLNAHFDQVESIYLGLVQGNHNTPHTRL